MEVPVGEIGVLRYTSCNRPEEMPALLQVLSGRKTVKLHEEGEEMDVYAALDGSVSVDFELQLHDSQPRPKSGWKECYFFEGGSTALLGVLLTCDPDGDAWDDDYMDGMEFIHPEPEERALPSLLQNGLAQVAALEPAGSAIEDWEYSSNGKLVFSRTVPPQEFRSGLRSYLEATAKVLLGF